MSDGRFVAALLVAVVLVVGGIGLVARQVTHHYDASNCRRFGQETSREVRFVEYTFWSWDCLTPSGAGQWISIDALREVG